MAKIMKYCFKILSLSLLLLLTFSCKSTRVEESVPESAQTYVFQGPDFSADGGKALDKLWDYYFESKDQRFLDYIFAYIDSEDCFMKGLNERHDEIAWDKKALAILDRFGIEDLNSTFECPIDYELLMGTLIKDDEVKEDLTYLYAYLSDQAFLRGVVKSAAFWSANSVAEQYPEVNDYLTKKIPQVNSKARNTFILYNR
ncbi:MAG: hypothetical protein K6C97_04060 [Treponema sp.]|nr:hypothetical protein [Treponema sp.]